MPFKPDSVRIHQSVDADYEELEKNAKAKKQPEAAIWKVFQTALTRVKNDGQWGEVIPRSKIPAHFKTKYKADNLYCVDLNFYRAFYTIEARVVVWLDIVDHAQYDKWFPNKGK